MLLPFSDVNVSLINVAIMKQYNVLSGAYNEWS